MIKQKISFYKSFTFLGLIGIFASWLIIYCVWVTYPNRVINDDKLHSKNLTENIWKGIPYVIPTEEEIKGQSYYLALGEKYGTYGDMYGSLNTLFSGLAFATLIISIFLQMIELRETRKELANQSKALSDQKSESSAQTLILENQYKLTSFQHIEAIKQNFLHQFYALMEERRFRLKNIEVYTDLNANLSTHQYEYTTKNSVVGINAFRVYLEQIEAQLCTKINRVKQTKKTNILFMRHLFFCFESQRFYQISPILNLTDNLLMTIKDLNLNISIDQEIDIEIYINLIASSLYPEEAAIIFWYGILSPEWKKLIEETALLRYFSYGHAHDLAPIFYDLKAFGENNNWKSIYEKFNTYQQ